MKKFAAYIFVIVSLNSCFVQNDPTYNLPYSYDERAPEIWKLGWQHGCKSGFSAYGNNYYKSLYKFTQDVDRMKDETYYKGWMDSFNYCRAYINRYLSGDRLSYEENPTLISNTKMDFTGGGKRDDKPITRSGIFGGNDNKGFFGDVFEMKAPGYGESEWGSDPYGGSCDFLNRCGSDKPKDPIDALIGQ